MASSRRVTPSPALTVRMYVSLIVVQFGAAAEEGAAACRPGVALPHTTPGRLGHHPPPGGRGRRAVAPPEVGCANIRASAGHEDRIREWRRESPSRFVRTIVRTPIQYTLGPTKTQCSTR